MAWQPWAPLFGPENNKINEDNNGNDRNHMMMKLFNLEIGMGQIRGMDFGAMHTRKNVASSSMA